MVEEFEVEKYILAVDDPESIAASEKRAAKLEKEEDQFDFYVLHPACTVGLR